MGYEWIFDVLKDLRSFAQVNGMSALAAKADEALKIAAVEVLVLKDVSQSGPPPRPPSAH
jgi:hypothetical protein